MSAGAKGLRESFPGELDSLGAIRELVRSAARGYLDAAGTYRLELAVDEIATNIVVHGYEEASRKGEVDVGVAIDDELVAVTLEDDAAPYNPTNEQLPSPDDLTSPLGVRRTGGLGLLLARAVDVFRYERLDGRNRTTLGMRR